MTRASDLRPLKPRAAEQLGKAYTGSEHKKHLKKMQRRARRRVEKEDPENAPKRERYSGWGD